MSWSVDARIPVVMVDAAGLAAALAAAPNAAILVEAGADGGAVLAADRFVPDAAHPPGCACCGARSQDAAALDRLFQARVRGRLPWFDRVVVLATPAGQAAVAAALTDDALTKARFRLAG